MAVDTPTKRSSALNVRTRSRRFLPVPDGSIAIADRAHLAGVYYEAPAAVTVYPNGDGTLNGWTDESFGTTNLWSHVDEPTASPNDSDYITCLTASSDDPVFLLLGDMPSDFSAMGGTIVVKFRGRKISGEFGAIGIFQSDETTALTDTSTPSTTTSLAVYTLTLTVTGATSKAAWDGARLRIGTNAAGSTELIVTAIQVDVTYTPTGGSSPPGSGTNQNASIFLAI